MYIRSVRFMTVYYEFLWQCYELGFWNLYFYIVRLFVVCCYNVWMQESHAKYYWHLILFLFLPTTPNCQFHFLCAISCCMANKAPVKRIRFKAWCVHPREKQTKRERKSKMAYVFVWRWVCARACVCVRGELH